MGCNRWQPHHRGANQALPRPNPGRRTPSPVGRAFWLGRVPVWYEDGHRIRWYPHVARYAELFTWVLDVPISEEQAMRCAKREPGRSWEAIESELHKLGVRSTHLL